jgi:hypothetical protein
MEIFIFPELLYSLVIANIMSPEIWKWREDPWFAGIEKMSPMRKLHRVKQYIMDHYDFNLDLETWGLTDKETELNRFRDFIDPSVLARSNALFGYEGDKYYFDIDIRRHFGLDQYDSEVIPYWKTETVEAMNAFRFKPEHEQGAGECVSLACLYAAALFIVAKIPLEKIFLMGTPLHSQNFILIDEGVLTNNRRIVTKTMWYNGTELSALARRALEHEQVTIVAHHSGYIHTIYPEATIDPTAYNLFRERLARFLETKVDFEIFINYLRDYSRYQKFFQLVLPCHGSEKFIPLEKAFGYEHGSKNRLGDKTARKLFCEIDEEDLYTSPIDGRIPLRSDDRLFYKSTYSEFLDRLLEQFPSLHGKEEFIHDLKRFVHIVPYLPKADKWLSVPTDHQRGKQADCIALSTSQTREEIIDYLSSFRLKSQVPSTKHQVPSTQYPAPSTQYPAPSTQYPALSTQYPALSTQYPAPSTQYPAPSTQYPAPSTQYQILNPSALVADLAFYAGRYMDRCDWKPFLNAALQRNPVSIGFFRQNTIGEVQRILEDWPDESIYDGNRLALPDEVVNFRRGDGIEKAITLGNIIKSRNRIARIIFQLDGGQVLLSCPEHRMRFTTTKDFGKLEFSL